MRAFRTYVLFPIVVLLTAALLLPLIKTDVWWIRFLDFPRIQVLILLAVALGLVLLLGGWRSHLGKVVILVATASLLYRLVGVAPYVLPVDLNENAVCIAGTDIKVMVANVQKNNRLEDPFLELVARTDPDVLLIMETDTWWDQVLLELHTTYPHWHQHIPEDARFFGMHLFSKLELVDSRVELYAELDTPTILADVRFSDGDMFTFIGVHPRPPNLHGLPATRRNANLMAAALDARDAEFPVVMGGDFNLTPWDPTMQHMLRVGGLQDPREHAGLIPTFSATNWAMAWPLDHIVHQNGLVMKHFDRLPPFGSDHYAVTAEVCLRDTQGDPVTLQPLTPEDLDDAHEAIEKARHLDEAAPNEATD